MRRARVPGCLAFGRGLRHSLAFVHALHRRCVINKEAACRVASQLSLDPQQVEGVVRLLRSINYIPSFERLALIAQRDPWFDDNDIAEMFGRTPDWSEAVRAQADRIRSEELIPMEREILTDEDFREGDYEARRLSLGRRNDKRVRVEIKSFEWDGFRASFVPHSA